MKVIGLVIDVARLVEGYLKGLAEYKRQWESFSLHVERYLEHSYQQNISSEKNKDWTDST